jgi:hypothetical protein
VTQEQLDKLAARARSEGKSTATKDVLAQLGVEDIEAAKAALTAHQERVDAEKDEVQRAKDEAVTAKREAEEARAETAMTKLSTRKERLLLASGVEIKALDYISELVKVDPSATDEEIVAAVDQLKEDIPQMFAEPEGAPAAPSWAPKGGTGDQKPPAAKSGMDAGRELYASMFPKAE